MSKNIQYAGQLHLFEAPRYRFSDLGNTVIEHARNFRIEMAYLRENLPQYSRYLKKDWMQDNLLLRTMFRGIENSKDMPPEIFGALNALEICLIEAGIFKRKSFYFGDMVVRQKDGIHQELISVRRKPLSLHNVSRIKEEGHLDGKHLYEIVTYLLTATDIDRIYAKYKKDWQIIFQLERPEIKQKRFKRLNPYDPLTLKQRMDCIERQYPDAFWKLKKVLAEPFTPEKVVRRKRYETKAAEQFVVAAFVHGDVKMAASPSEPLFEYAVVREGFNKPRTIEGYVKQVYDYFQMKERMFGVKIK